MLYLKLRYLWLRIFLFSEVMFIIVSIGIKYYSTIDLAEDKNKPLDKTENKIYKRRIIITLGIMLIFGKVKNCALTKRSNFSE